MPGPGATAFADRIMRMEQATRQEPAFREGWIVESKAFQDHYAEAVSHCYGCGRSNESGLHVKSYWEGEESVCRFDPKPYHTGIPGYVYGGLIASVIDCHATATASASACRAEGHEVGTVPMSRFVTGSLRVDYLLPTPIDHPMVFRARVTEMKGRKAVVSISMVSAGEERVRGELVAVRIPANWLTGTAP